MAVVIEQMMLDFKAYVTRRKLDVDDLGIDLESVIIIVYNLK